MQEDSCLAAQWAWAIWAWAGVLEVIVGGDSQYFSLILN